MPGVVGAWVAGQLGLADDFMLDAASKPPVYRCPVLAKDRVRFEGEAVAAVAAETAYQAQDAADAVKVEYTPQALDTEPLEGRPFGTATSRRPWIRRR